jgi:hypothetical protein
MAEIQIQIFAGRTDTQTHGQLIFKVGFGVLRMKALPASGYWQEGAGALACRVPVRGEGVKLALSGIFFFTELLPCPCLEKRPALKQGSWLKEYISVIHLIMVSLPDQVQLFWG